MRNNETVKSETKRTSKTKNRQSLVVFVACESIFGRPQILRKFLFLDFKKKKIHRQIERER